MTVDERNDGSSDSATKYSYPCRLMGASPVRNASLDISRRVGWLRMLYGKQDVTLWIQLGKYIYSVSPKCTSVHLLVNDPKRAANFKLEATVTGFAASSFRNLCTSPTSFCESLNTITKKRLKRNSKGDWGKISVCHSCAKTHPALFCTCVTRSAQGLASCLDNPIDKTHQLLRRCLIKKGRAQPSLVSEQMFYQEPVDAFTVKTELLCTLCFFIYTVDFFDISLYSL